MDAVSPSLKRATCRYFLNTGTCFYGGDCQFSHSKDNNSMNGSENTQQMDLMNYPQDLSNHNAIPLNNVLPEKSSNHSQLIQKRERPMLQPILQEQQDDRSPLADEEQTLTIENVGGTTYFYSEEALETQGRIVVPQFSVYSGAAPNIVHMEVKPNMPSFFMADDVKLEILRKQAVTLTQMEDNPRIPAEVDKYSQLFPLEIPTKDTAPKSSTFGFPTTTYKAVNTKDGLVYCLRRIHGFRLSSTKCMSVIEKWKALSHSNIVSLREVFTSKVFDDNSMIFVYDYMPRAETLMTKHFMNSMANNNMMKGGSRHNSPLLPESLIWSYIVQLSSALRSIHSQGLACRVMDPTKILLTDKCRIRLNCVGIFDVLSFDVNQENPMAAISHYQQEDLISLGKLVLALSCNSVIGIQRDHIQNSVELIARNYSTDLKNLILYLLTNQNRLRNVNDIMPMIGARFYTQLDAAQLRSDVLESELTKEVENGRLFRLLCKLNVIIERPEVNMDSSWSETGDRYILKLFRDYLFHQVDENGGAWVDMAHIVQCINRFDAGSHEKICLTSRDGHTVIIVTYEELKRCFETAFNELLSTNA